MRAFRIYGVETFKNLEFSNTAVRITRVDIDVNKRGCRRGLRWDSIFAYKQVEKMGIYSCIPSPTTGFHAIKLFAVLTRSEYLAGDGRHFGLLQKQIKTSHKNGDTM